MTLLMEYGPQISLLLLYWLILAGALSNVFTLKCCEKGAFRYYGWALLISILFAGVAMVFVGITCWEILYNEPPDDVGTRWLIYHMINGIVILMATCGLKDYIKTIELKQNSPG